MTFKEYLAILWRRKFIIIIPIILATAIVVFLGMRARVSYTASATVRVPTTPIGSLDYVNINLFYNDRLMNTYTFIATSDPITNELQERLGINNLPRIRVEPIFDTELIRISVTASNAETAANVANTLAEIFIARVDELQGSASQPRVEILREQIDNRQAELNTAREEYRSLVEEFGTQAENVIAASRSLNVLEEAYTRLLAQYEDARINERAQISPATIEEPAGIPTRPNRPNLTLNVMLALILSAGFSLTLAFLLESLDNRLYSLRAVQRTGHLPIINEIPRGGIVTDSKSIRLTAFRDLRTSLYLMYKGERLQSLLITGSNVGVDTSAIVGNLGVATARGGRKAVIIDANLRAPKLHKLFNVENKQGLSDICTHNLDVKDVLHETQIDGLHLITAGAAVEDPPEMLASSSIVEMLNTLAAQYDLILVDAPPITAATDARVLSTRLNASVLVVRLSQTTTEELHEAKRQFEMVSANLLGVVVST